MINWYYVQGSERVGPVGLEALKDLFTKKEINIESYVWRKGFQNWERIKDVTELDFSNTEEAIEQITERRVDKVAPSLDFETKKERTSPEINFNFDWKSVRDDEELFFIKVGNDRKKILDSELFGPYSLLELRDAIDEKRINNHSLIFAAGMRGWVEVGDTPLDPKNIKINIHNVLDEAPLLVVIENDPIPLIALMQEAGLKKCTLLGAGPFHAGKEVMCSIYSGTVLKAINLKLTIEEYLPREQRVLCNVIELSENAKKIMQNYAD